MGGFYSCSLRHNRIGRRGSCGTMSTANALCCWTLLLLLALFPAFSLARLAPGKFACPDPTHRQSLFSVYSWAPSEVNHKIVLFLINSMMDTHAHLVALQVLLEVRDVSEDRSKLKKPSLDLLEAEETTASAIIGFRTRTVNTWMHVCMNSIALCFLSLKLYVRSRICTCCHLCDLRGLY